MRGEIIRKGSRAPRTNRYNDLPMEARSDPELFREVFGRFATGVAVVTVAGPGGVGGMTANALCSLSLEPLLALVCFANNARTLDAVRDAGRFAVNLLADDQHDVAAAFASKMPEADKLALVQHRLVAGMPVIDGTLAWAVLELRELLKGGDHTIAIGEVLHLGLGTGRPLLWFEGSYRTLPAGGPQRSPEGY
jgi:3-hydroxy-9,10-secoandrosta-1,3,5(10)-triene-9,17-dione monooxygenase reductase component